MTALPPLLTVADVRERYGLRDDRAARSIMRRAGGFVVANRTMIRASDLDAWECAQAEAGKAAASAGARAQDAPRGRARGRGKPGSRRAPTGPLPAGWYEGEDAR